MSHDLTMKNLIDWISICESLLKRNKIESFLKRAYYGRWKLDHVRQKCTKKIVVKARWRFINGSKARINAKKSDAVCEWWDWKEIVYYELLPPNQTIDLTSKTEKITPSNREKAPELIGSIEKSAIMTTPDSTHLWRAVKNWENLTILINVSCLWLWWALEILITIINQF